MCQRSEFSWGTGLRNSCSGKGVRRRDICTLVVPLPLHGGHSRPIYRIAFSLGRQASENKLVHSVRRTSTSIGTAVEKIDLFPRESMVDAPVADAVSIDRFPAAFEDEPAVFLLELRDRESLVRNVNG